MSKYVLFFWSFLILIATFRCINSYSKQISLYSVSDCKNPITNIFAEVISNPSYNDVSQSFVIKGLSGCIKDKSIKIRTKLEPKYFLGEQVLITGKVTKPINFTSGEQKTFDYIGYLAKDDIYFEIRSAKVSHIIGHGHPSSENIFSYLFDYFEKGLSKIRSRLIDNIRMVLGEPHASLASGLILGEKSSLGADLLDDFRKAGLIHIVVLSGFNITIVGDIIKKILSPLNRTWSISLGAFAILSFATMVGGGATVVRSTIMALIQYFGTYIRRDYKVDRALYFAGLIMIIHNPLILTHDPSFHLSFLATLGLIYLANPMKKLLRRLPERFQIRDIVSSTIATQIFVTPYIIFLMGTISIAGLITNLLVLPIIPLTMAIVSIISLITLFSYTLGMIFGYFGYILLAYELSIVRIFARLPVSSIETGSISSKLMLSIYSIYAIAIYQFKDKIFMTEKD